LPDDAQAAERHDDQRDGPGGTWPRITLSTVGRIPLDSLSDEAKQTLLTAFRDQHPSARAD
jgi:hypothetical protein